MQPKWVVNTLIVFEPLQVNSTINLSGDLVAVIVSTSGLYCVFVFMWYT